MVANLAKHYLRILANNNGGLLEYSHPVHSMNKGSTLSPCGKLGDLSSLLSYSSCGRKTDSCIVRRRTCYVLC
jgi:hypothetical protein